MKRFMIILLAALCLAGCTPKTPDGGQNGVVSGDIPPPTEPEALPDEVEKLRSFLNEAGLLKEVKRENAEDYSFDGFEHIPEEYYALELDGGEFAFIRLYGSPETAADEASNYSGSGSEYGYDGGGMVIDYACPIHFWLSGNAIIEYGSFENDTARLLEGLYGKQFAGSPIPERDSVAFGFSSVSASAGETDLPDAAPINTREELEEYYNALKDSYYWSLENEPQIGEFEAKLEDYPEDWFEENSLIIIYAYSGSSPADFQVDAVTYANKEYQIVLSGTFGDGTAEVEKYIFLELSGRKLAEGSIITLINAYTRPYDPDADGRERLTIEKLIEILNEEDGVTWSDFENYRSDDVGSGLYILRFFLEDRGYLLTVSGVSPDPDAEPQKLVLHYITADEELECDLLNGDLAEFLKQTGYSSEK